MDLGVEIFAPIKVPSHVKRQWKGLQMVHYLFYKRLPKNFFKNQLNYMDPTTWGYDLKYFVGNNDLNLNNCK
jgi:hypothetical protein